MSTRLRPGAPAAGTDLRWTDAVRLVAGREVTTRLRSRAFRIVTVVLVVVIVAFAVIMKVVVGSAHHVQHVGLTGSASSLSAPLRAAAEQAGLDVDLVTVRGAPSGVAQVRSGRLDALVEPVGESLRVTVHKDLDATLKTVLTAIARQLALDQEIRRLGGNPSTVAGNVTAATVDVVALEPPQKFDPQRLAMGTVAGILIFLALQLTGTSVAQGVVEEKSSRVVELLLATIRPWHLMAGKVLGIGAVGLVQVLAVGVAGAVAGKATGALSLPTSVALGSVGWLLLWFVLGFVAYALIFAGLGALVSRQEDVGGAVGPALMFLIVGYILGITILPSDPGNSAVAGLSVIPLFSPTLMPMRLAMGAVPGWQIGLALALMALTIPALVWLSARIYRNAVVRSGARVRLRDAVRAG